MKIAAGRISPRGLQRVVLISGVKKFTMAGEHPDEATSGLNWWLISCSTGMDDVSDELAAAYLEWTDHKFQSDPIQWTSAYSPTGRYFARPPQFRRTRTHLLVTQHWGWDV